MLDLDDLIDISNPSRPNENENKMARCLKSKMTSMKLTVMVEELAMETHRPTPQTAMCDTHPGVPPRVRREATLP